MELNDVTGSLSGEETTMENAILTKQTSKGTVDVTAAKRNGMYIAVATLNGSEIAAEYPLKLRKSITSNGVTYTHHIDTIALTTAEYDTIRQEIRAITDPTPNLCNARDQLVRRYHGLIEDADAEFERLHDAEDPGAWAAKRKREPEIEAALQAIKQFDIDHPEIVAAIKAESKASAERHMWD
jgi:hypothetical protein